MAICKYCKAAILWGRSANGNPMPLDYVTRRILVADDFCATDQGFTEDGRKINGRPPQPSERGEVVYTPHWATCTKKAQQPAKQKQQKTE